MGVFVNLLTLDFIYEWQFYNNIGVVINDALPLALQLDNMFRAGVLNLIQSFTVDYVNFFATNAWGCTKQQQLISYGINILGLYLLEEVIISLRLT